MIEPPIAQQEFLRDAMNTLNMTRDEFADRIGTNRRRLDNWLLPSESSGFREMDEMAWKFIREILKSKSKRA
ncbi:transcriptional regulator [Massilia sp. CCM 8734]|uniref:transcriptional regulator n=1 Tax=Massilia sp. CCM 8734 TaxID=2609283 RepID=UPI0014204713|nr:transcriptional regulator [Massilia sp. CCM 8734]NHZ99116.1 transcriptional regulator [Massilia sp. CCM 8734]